jgi:hypothetical protein
VEARPPGVSLLSTINQEGPSCDKNQYAVWRLQSSDCASYNLVETLRGTQASRAGANDEDVNGTRVERVSAFPGKTYPPEYREGIPTCLGGSFCLVGYPGSWERG